MSIQPNQASSDAPRIYPIAPISNGQITMMPRPRSETLNSDMAFYRQAGITHIVNLLREPEMERLQLGTEGTSAKQHAIEYLHFPVRDMEVPSFEALRQLNQELLSLLDQGAHIAVHCNGGRGRAGTVAVSLMLESGITLNDALQIAREKRGDIVPVCELQENFLVDYDKKLQFESFARDNK